jgi:hypothetical protein
MSGPRVRVAKSGGTVGVMRLQRVDGRLVFRALVANNLTIIGLQGNVCQALKLLYRS